MNNDSSCRFKANLCGCSVPKSYRLSIGRCAICADTENKVPDIDIIIQTSESKTDQKNHFLQRRILFAKISGLISVEEIDFLTFLFCNKTDIPNFHNEQK